MKKLLIIMVLLGSGIPILHSQTPFVDTEGQDLFANTPQEDIFIHYNTSLLFPGEYLYYSLYCLNSDTGLPSEISKIAYVELVGENGERVFRHKLQLENGRGGSDFFLPTSLPSGNYKLLGYTRWMLNEEENHLFSANMAIINPYRGDQSAIMASTSEVADEPNQNQSGVAAIASEERTFTAKKDQNLEINTNGEAFGKREKVLLNIQGANGSAATGVYSVSVRRAGEIVPPPQKDANNYVSSVSTSNDRQAPLHVPEVRGNLLKGRLKPVGGENLPVQGKKIVLSIPGEDFAFKVATTDEKGVFHFNIMNDYSGSEALLQLIGPRKEDYLINLIPPLDIDYSLLDFGDFNITPKMHELVLQRSIYNQIENSYYSVKPDTIQVGGQADPFYGEEPETYDLDEYTRFKTIRETFIEIINSAWITKDQNGDPVLEVRGLEGAMEYNLPPLLLVDGAMVQDHSQFIDFPANAVQKIGILRNNFYVGAHIFQGIIDVETIEGEFHQELNNEYIQKFELDKPQPEKTYFHQTYNDSTSTAHIPDFRSQLLWMPLLKLNDERRELTFFTSDNTGTYEIALEGFTGEGTPVSVRKYIIVE